MADDAATHEELAKLEEAEGSLSARRRRLHDRIDFARSSGDVTVDAEARLAQMVEEERELSAERKELHRRIDELRLGLGLEPGPAHRARLRD